MGKIREIVRDVSPESLARANEDNLAEGLAACACAYGGEVSDEPDLLWCATGLHKDSGCLSLGLGRDWTPSRAMAS